MVVEVCAMWLTNRLVAIAAILFVAGCGNTPEAVDTSNGTSTTRSPTTMGAAATITAASVVPTEASIAPTTTTEVVATTLPATTVPTETSTSPTTSEVQAVVTDLRSILEPYEDAAVTESNGYWRTFEFDRCWRVSQSGRDASDPPIDQHEVVARGDVFDCYLRTDPPADVLNDFYVIVLDDAGNTWANGGGTDGSWYLPAIPSGLLCREYLAHPDFLSSMGDHGAEATTGDSWWMDNDWAYASVLSYWFLDGERSNMDVDQNGIPCELLFDQVTVARVWAGNQP